MTPSEYFGNMQYMEEHHENDYKRLPYGVRLAYESWMDTKMESEYELELQELLEDSHTIDDFLNTLCKVGLKSFVYTCTECYAVQSIYDIIEAGCEFLGVCRIPHCFGYRGEGECTEIEGIRFKVL